MIFLSRKYLLLLSPKLQQFKQKKDDLFNFRCPFCGDSHKNRFKSRGYVYEKGGEYFYRCHNCSYSTTFAKFLKEQDPSLYGQYVLEKFGTPLYKNIDNYTTIGVTRLSFETPNKTIHVDSLLESIAELPEQHWVRQYTQNRKIPIQFHSEIYYAPDFKRFCDDIKPNHDKDLIENDPRIVIPFYDENNILTGFQGRALKNEVRYITMKLVEPSLKLYGMNRIDRTQDIYVLEGPFDSMFLPNAIAVGDSNLRNAANYYPKEQLILVYDNEYHNKEIKREISKAISDNFRVMIWPKNWPYKDINEMVMKIDFYQSTLRNALNNWVYQGLRAQLEFQNVTG